MKTAPGRSEQWIAMLLFVLVMLLLVGLLLFLDNLPIRTTMTYAALDMARYHV